MVRYRQRTDSFTTGMVAYFCRVSLKTITRSFDSGLLAGFKIPGTSNRRFTLPQLRDFMVKNKIPSDLLDDYLDKAPSEIPESWQLPSPEEYHAQQRLPYDELPPTPGT